MPDTAVPNTARPAMSGSNTGCTRASTGSCAASASTAAAASASAGEQWAGPCNQQCRYGGHCDKLCYPRHDDLLLVFNSACEATRPVRSKSGAQKAGVRPDRIELYKPDDAVTFITNLWEHRHDAPERQAATRALAPMVDLKGRGWTADAA
ncbi:hypothetical protein NLM33_42835 [Bradyrhizobium sp. CCGUVB1N3]|uniref:hypothetical protein n=1 Tax=Bradyrhizobium sp. CCGUVB1N3 TaxID=2949629 RepID=UPI0020B22392|nr:hypothetical protein [Bradyrhizobium sp. CCGUVB1N3]MCP3476898.1 hypothetical protein [Bradyrhizobium sp. CCGUVB1N3]